MHTCVTKKRTHQEINVKLSQSESKYAIQTDKDDISLPAVIVFLGSRGSGKTYSCIQLMRHFEKKRYITRTFLLCPTCESNDLYSNLKTLQKKDCYDDDNTFHASLHTILDQMKRDWHEYEQEEE